MIDRKLGGMNVEVQMYAWIYSSIPRVKLFFDQKKKFLRSFFKVLRIGILQIWTVNVP